MKVILEGNPTEIAALVVEIQERRKEMSQEEREQTLSKVFQPPHTSIAFSGGDPLNKDGSSGGKG